MTKTPEEMAEEYTKDWWGNLPEAEGMRKSARENFLAGYKAGQEHPFQFQTKMWVDPIGPQYRWISVKDRLPEEGQEVLIFGKILNDTSKVLGVRARFQGDQKWKCTWESEDIYIYTQDDVTHWMPLPKPPEDK